MEKGTPKVSLGLGLGLGLGLEDGTYNIVIIAETPHRGKIYVLRTTFSLYRAFPFGIR